MSHLSGGLSRLHPSSRVPAAEERRGLPQGGRLVASLGVFGSFREQWATKDIVSAQKLRLNAS